MSREPHAANFYFSGNYPPGVFTGYKRRADLMPYSMFSFFDIQNDVRQVHAMREGGVELMLDSGAFSVFTGRAKLSKEDYARFVEAHGSLFVACASLDVIDDPEQSWLNYEWLRVRVPVFPVFHSGEAWDLFDAYVATNPSILGIGGLAGGKSRGPEAQAGLHRAFSKLANPGEPTRIPLHGFAIGPGPLMQEYPWGSADSASAARAAGGGTLLYFDGKGLRIFNCRGGALFDASRVVSQEERAIIDARLAENGMCLHGVSEYPELRIASNVLEMRRMVDTMPKVYTPPAPRDLTLDL